ncbi:MAG: sugar ABC transporter ATP-binding protein [Verrucomicrobia bacterium]|nr:sugar ABC transporter ATP-binding protein [Verrucomicrobiota bacterium]
MRNGTSLLAMRGIHKRFPGVHALKGVDLEVQAGEVHAVVGENGAGKSTLMHILAGVYRPDEGTIAFRGRSNVVIADEHSAQQLGIAIVFQERSLFGPLSVAENVFAGRQPVNRWGKIDRRALYDRTRVCLRRVALAVEPEVSVEHLSPAQQQLVEVAKALSVGARLIIFDEPTAALTETETSALFRVIAQLQSQGVGIIYISHRLEEIFQIADRVTVLKDGAGQGTRIVRETHPGELICRMVGRDLALLQRQSRGEPNTNPVRLEVAGLNDAEEFRGSRPYLQEISFQIRGGEILVLAGLAGAGRTELALSLFGVRPRASGEIRVDGRRVNIHSPAEAIEAGLGYAPEDRKDSGLFLDRSIAQNVVAARLNDFGAWWFKDRQGETVTEEFRRKLRVACTNVNQPVQELSGGNQQKIVLARWLLVDPKVLIVDEPTRGIDVGAKAEVHSVLRELASRGTAVIVISSDLPEVLAVADRVLVLCDGRIVGELKGDEASEEKVMRCATISR